MRRVYLDSAPVIYLVEGVYPYYANLQSLLQPSDLLTVSDLSRLECRVQPIRTGNTILLGHYDAFFNTRVAEIVSLTSEVIDRATEIRARYRYSVADSIHLAAAIVAQCDLFLTNDLRLTNFRELPVATL
ncbi:MAG: PIN domain-containing protein [Fimbriimonadales bacterium]|nr:PIN domain-containing protein [Fimbriimonadales bacterium]